MTITIELGYMKGCGKMDKYFNIDELMVDYAEMTSFDFTSGNYLAISTKNEDFEEYSRQPFTFKYGNFDILDMLKSMFSREKSTSNQSL